MSTNEGSWLKRHKILTVIIALIAIGVLASALGGGDSSNTQNNAQSNTENSASTNTATAKIGEPVRDGQFEFVVKSIECGKASVTDNSGYLSQSAQGQYCLLALSVKNIGDKQQYFSQSDQKLLNSEGAQYSPDTGATITLGGSDAFGSQINPGNSVEGTIVFDVPKDQTPTTAQFHDSAWSNGVKVSLE